MPQRPLTFRTRLVGLGALLLVAGCAKPLLSPNEPRTQFDAYDARRNQYAPQYVEDAFGFRKANLRGRLLRSD